MVYTMRKKNLESYGVLILEASNLADTKFEIPRSWYKAKTMANYHSFWRPAESKELDSRKEALGLGNALRRCESFLMADAYTQSSTQLMGNQMQKARWVARGDQHAEVFEHDHLDAMSMGLSHVHLNSCVAVRVVKCIDSVALLPIKVVNIRNRAEYT